MNLRLVIILLAISIFGGSLSAAADSYSFSTLPAGGDVSAAAGDTAGWGYSITNNSASQWLVITNLIADPFVDGFADASLFDFPIVAPGQKDSVPYDPSSFTGLYAFTWDASAPSTDSNSGKFTLQGEWWSDDPFAGGAFLQDAEDESASFSVTVVSSVQPVPEPATVNSLLFGLIGLGGIVKKQMAPKA